MKRALILVLFAAGMAGPGGLSARQGSRHDAVDGKQRSPLSGDSVYLLNSSWTDQEGSSIHLSHFQGKPVVMAMIYTSCKDACPMITLDMQNIQSALPDSIRGQVQFALFSFDPDQDSPAQLRNYASAHGLDTKFWTLLTGSADSARLLAAVLGVRYKKQSNGEFAHSSLITVLNSAGEIRLQQAGLRKDPAEITATIKGLLSSAK